MAAPKISHAEKSKLNTRGNQERIMSSKKGKEKEKSIKSPSKHTLLQTPSTTNWNGQEIRWEWTVITSPATSRVSPIFTKDGGHFFSLVGSSVKIHSTITGQIVSTLKSPSSSSTSSSQPKVLSCAVINPHNPFQLITGSLDGSLMIWDFLDGSLLKTIEIAQPVHYLCVHEQFKDYVFVAVSRPSKNTKQDQNAVVMRVSLQNVGASTNSTSLRSAEVLAVGKTRFPTGLAISPNGAWLVATAGHKVYVARTSALTAGFTKYVSPERLTCLAFHPLEEYFATGDKTGVVRLWYCLNDESVVNVKGVEKKTQTSPMHWHAHSVSTLTFTANGAYLLSGGEEAVLVIWQLHTGRKEFVPRVGSAISSVSVTRSTNGEEYLLGLADATYVFINAGTLKISRSYSRLKIDPGTYDHNPSPSKAPSTPLEVHSLSSTLILPSSHPSSLQVYYPSTSTVISELEISPSNRVSRREDKPIEASRVERCVISSSGYWMATVDTRENDGDFRTEIYLKLWFWDDKSSVWVLNTRIDKPHTDKKIVSLEFSPGHAEDMPLQLVTAGQDGIVKLWRLRGRKLKTEVKEESWVTRATLKYRSEKPRIASWSHDASLLAVSYESCVVIYETTAYATIQTLAPFECASPRIVQFIGGRNLLIAGKTRFVLWDILTHAVCWHQSTSCDIQSVFLHPSRSSFAVFEIENPDSNSAQTTRISFFALQSPKPTKVFTLPFILQSKAWFSNTAEPSHYSFLGIDQGWNLVAFGDSVNLSGEDVSAKKLVTDNTVNNPTLLESIFGPLSINLVNTSPYESTLHQVPLSSKSSREILETPAYLTPAINTFFDSLIDTFLKKRVGEVEAQPLDALRMDIDEDDKMEEEKPQMMTIASVRTVSSSEMNDFIGLFRKHAIQDRAPSSHVIRPTGKAANGRNSSTASASPHKLLPNGTSHQSKQQPTVNARDQSSNSSPSSSPTLVNGKKRKKS